MPTTLPGTPMSTTTRIQPLPSFGWKTVIEKTYGHRTYYLMAVDTQSSAPSTKHLDLSPQHSARCTKHSNVVGILPLVHMRHFIFGNKLVSIPFFDMGGILVTPRKLNRPCWRKLSTWVASSKPTPSSCVTPGHCHGLKMVERVQGVKDSRIQVKQI